MIKFYASRQPTISMVLKHVDNKSLSNKIWNITV